MNFGPKSVHELWPNIIKHDFTSHKDRLDGEKTNELRRVKTFYGIKWN